MTFANELRTIAVEHSAADFAKMHEIAKHLHENPAEKHEFAKNPNAWVFRFNGFEVPEGHHLHVSDENNSLIPAEEYGVFGADERPMWGRSEIRVGYKTTSLVECG